MSREDIDEVRQPVSIKRPPYLTGTAIALMLVGVWYLLVLSLFIILPMFHHYVRSSPLVPMLISVGVVVSLALVTSGAGVIRGTSWSRPMAIVGMLSLVIKTAFPVLFTHAPLTLLVQHWVELVFYLCISLLLFTRGADTFFQSTADRRTPG